MENYFLTIRDGCVFYNELETRVKLVRRRQFSNKVGVRGVCCRLLSVGIL